jgi:hypothetical protein
MNTELSVRRNKRWNSKNRNGCGKRRNQAVGCTRGRRGPPCSRRARRGPSAAELLHRHRLSDYGVLDRRCGFRLEVRPDDCPGTHVPRRSARHDARPGCNGAGKLTRVQYRPPSWRTRFATGRRPPCRRNCRASASGTDAWMPACYWSKRSAAGGDRCRLSGSTRAPRADLGADPWAINPQKLWCLRNGRLHDGGRIFGRPGRRRCACGYGN